MRTKPFGHPLPILGAALAAMLFGAPAALAANPVTPIPAMTARLAAKLPLTAIVRAGAALVAVGDYGTIIRSTDDGRTWQQARVPVSSPLTSVHFVDERRGWAVGHGGVILASVDGGASWQLQTVLDERPVLLSVHFTDERSGYAVGAYGTAFRSDDGGATWEPMAVGEGNDADMHLNHLFSTRGGALFIAAEGGLAFRSDDRGASWTKLETDVSGSLWSGFECADGEVVLLGMTGKVIASRDRGQTWQSRETGTEQSLTGGVVLADGGLLVVGSGGVMLRSRAGGAFELEVRADRQNLAAVAAAPAGNIVLAGQLGVERLERTR